MGGKEKRNPRTKDAKKIRSGLCCKWFKEETGGDYYCRFYISGRIKTSVRTKVGGYSPRKYKSLNDWHIAKIVRELYFNDIEQFYGFVNCPFKKEGYQQMLNDKGIIKL